MSAASRARITLHGSPKPHSSSATSNYTALVTARLSPAKRNSRRLARVSDSGPCIRSPASTLPLCQGRTKTNKCPFHPLSRRPSHRAYQSARPASRARNSSRLSESRARTSPIASPTATKCSGRHNRARVRASGNPEEDNDLSHSNSPAPARSTRRRANSIK